MGRLSGGLVDSAGFNDNAQIDYRRDSKSFSCAARAKLELGGPRDGKYGRNGRALSGSVKDFHWSCSQWVGYFWDEGGAVAENRFLIFG